MPDITKFQLAVSLIGSLTIVGGALAYCRNVRVERPPIGVFNGRDLVVLGLFIVVLPAMYLVLPAWALTAVLVGTFLAAGRIGLGPLLSPRTVWLIVPAALAADLLLARFIDAVPAGAQAFWVVNSVIVGFAAVTVGNLYVQGGLTLRHVAWFTLLLGVYDVVFTVVLPITAKLAFALQGRPLDPSFGMLADDLFAVVGIGDGLAFSMYAAAAYKGYGRRGAVTAVATVVVFGAVLPSLLPLWIQNSFRGFVGSIVPVQTIFGPAALASYFWLSRGSAERDTRSWFALRARPAALRRARAGRAIPAVALAALLVAFLLGSGEDTRVAVSEARAAVTDTRTIREVVLEDGRFSPRHLFLRRGQTIHWTNLDRVPHNVVAYKGERFGSRPFGRGATFSFQPVDSGTIDYVCTLHPGMEATITVTA